MRDWLLERVTLAAVLCAGCAGAPEIQEAPADLTAPDHALARTPRSASSASYASYAFCEGNLGYVDACAGGTTVTLPEAGVALPFMFTLYGTTAAQVNLARNGQITVGTTPLDAVGTAVALPSTSAPHPVIFPFWDNLKYGTGGQICYQALGAAPYRQLVVEWQNMTFAAGNGSVPPSSLDFEAYLFEGTGEIDTVYNAMNGTSTSSGRESGAQATVGIQDETGTVATAQYQVSTYGTGSSYSYVPGACVFCVIDSTRYPAGTVSPTDACQVCAPSSSTSAWSSASDGTTCPGGTCAAGTCTTTGTGTGGGAGGSTSNSASGAGGGGAGGSTINSASSSGGAGGSTSSTTGSGAGGSTSSTSGGGGGTSSSASGGGGTGGSTTISGSVAGSGGAAGGSTSSTTGSGNGGENSASSSSGTPSGAPSSGGCTCEMMGGAQPRAAWLLVALPLLRRRRRLVRRRAIELEL
jgi:hypothetical protein